MCAFVILTTKVQTVEYTRASSLSWQGVDKKKKKHLNYKTVGNRKPFHYLFQEFMAIHS